MRKASKVRPPEPQQAGREVDKRLRVAMRTLQVSDPYLAAFVRKCGWRYAAAVDPQAAEIVESVRHDWKGAA